VSATAIGQDDGKETKSSFNGDKAKSVSLPVEVILGRDTAGSIRTRLLFSFMRAENSFTITGLVSY